MTDLADCSVDELLAIFNAHDASPVDALNACLLRIARLDDRVNATLTVLVERASKQAELATRRWMSGEQRPLEGIPYGLKDIIDTAGVRTTYGSEMYDAHMPTRSATVARRLDAAGAVLAAKLQTFEFASGATSATSNPWDLNRWSGGSSSGPAAALAARELPLTIGTDTAGSIAIPAAFCGVVGLKPTYGRVSRAGVHPLSWTLDHVGPMTRSAVDAAHALRVIAGHDPHDPTCSRTAVPDYSRSISNELLNISIGVPNEWFFEICAPEVELATRHAIQLLQENGASVNYFDLPSTRENYVHAIEFTLIYAEAASIHEAKMAQLDAYGDEFGRFLSRAQFTSAVDYLRALRLRHIIQLDFERAFDVNDVIILPAGVCVAPTHDRLVARIGNEERPLAGVISRPTAIMNIVGIPSMTVPAGFDDHGLPVAIQIAARPYDEQSCINVAHAFQQLTGFHTVLPPVVRDDFDLPPTVQVTDLPASIVKPVVTAAEDRVR